MLDAILVANTYYNFFSLENFITTPTTAFAATPTTKQRQRLQRHQQTLTSLQRPKGERKNYNGR